MKTFKDQRILNLKIPLLLQLIPMTGTPEEPPCGRLASKIRMSTAEYGDDKDDNDSDDENSLIANINGKDCPGNNFPIVCSVEEKPELSLAFI